MTTEGEKRVIPLELFFDLVFVFALTQVTALMSNDPSIAVRASRAIASWTEGCGVACVKSTTCITRTTK